METLDVEQCYAEFSFISVGELDIHPKQLGSMPYRNFRVPIYEHTDNKTIIHSSKRFFYFPIPFLNYTSAVGERNNVTGQHELRLSVQMWNEEVEKQITSYVGELMGKCVYNNQIEVVPFEKVISACHLDQSLAV